MEGPPSTTDSPPARNALLSEPFRHPRGRAGLPLPNVGRRARGTSACQMDDQTSRGGRVPAPGHSKAPWLAPSVLSSHRLSFTLKLVSAIGGPGARPAPARFHVMFFQTQHWSVPASAPGKAGLCGEAAPLLTLRRKPVPRLTVPLGLPGAGPICTHCPSVIINSTPFHCPKCCSVGDKLCGHWTHLWFILLLSLN